MAFVVLQHLSPDFESRMDELLGRQTKLPICQVTDGISVEPNQVYLIPPKKEMIISGGKLHLTDKDDVRGFSLPIDHFLRSLAHDLGRRSVAIILSGAGSDGSRGIREIREAGGLVLCQTPDTARFQGMPLSAKQTGVVDAFFEPEQMPEALLRYVRDPARRWDDAPDPDGPSGGSAVDDIVRLLRAEYGIDFAHYKPATVTRRIERRLALTNQLDIGAYARMLAVNPDELNALYRDLLIGVTRFFRDVEAYRRLDAELIPSILAATPPNQEIRVWVAGCATGEEAYSVAMLLHEHLEAARRPLNVRIFATDVHRHSLDIAAAGMYDADALEDVTPARRDRYFTREEHRYRVAKELRQLIVFARHNVINDAPFTRLDLITCRNLLIYFQPLVQKKVMSLFHFGMKTGGTLFLGPSETPGEVADEFDTIDAHWRMYRKRRDARLPDIRLPVSVLMPNGPSRPLLAGGRTWAGPHLLQVYDQLLAKVMPSSVLVDDSYQLVHTFGGAEKLLRVRAGRPSTNILDLVDDRIKASLLGALQHAYKERTAVRLTGLSEGDRDGTLEEVEILVEPLREQQSATTHFLVQFTNKGPRAAASGAGPIEVPGESRDYVNALESELRFTKESLQATIEELETSNEELQATNEELVASNEELQSTNEELHSVNEELYTVNVEHQRKITQLAELTDDLDNLLHSIDIGVLFLDEELCIRRYTAQAANVFRLLPQDIGRRIDSFAPTIQHPGLLDDVVNVLRARQPVERQVTDREGLIYLLRVLPYRGASGKHGVVVTLIDFTEVKRAEARVKRLSAIVETSGDAIIANDRSGKITGWNRGAEQHFRFSAEEAIGRHVAGLFVEDKRAELDEVLHKVMRLEQVSALETAIVRKDGARVEAAVTASPILDEHNDVVGTSIIARDISQRKRDEAEVQRALRMRDQFMAMLSHELRNPLAALMNGCVVLGRRDINPDRADRARAAIERQCRHMARLLDDLLDVSRMRQDGVEMRRRFIDLRATIDSAVERVRPIADASGLKLEVDMPDNEVVVFGDPDRLQQVEANLLGNAIKYTPAGRRIHLGVSVEGDRAVINVRDEGIGIPPTMLERIFEPFVRAVDEDTAVHGRPTSGMGLGLSLVRAFVQAHGGDVRARSEGEGKGAELVVKLPLAGSFERAVPTSFTPRTIDGEAVVLVEDQEDSRTLLSDILEDAGYTVTAVADGKHAVDLIMNQRPRIALVDIGLPTMSGYDVAREIRKQLPSTDIFLVALTGYGQQQDREAVVSAGFDQHLVKPIEIDTLLEVLRLRRPLRAAMS